MALLITIILFIIFQILDLQPLISLSYSIIVIILFSYISSVRIKFLEYIGKDSLIFYLAHLYLMKIQELTYSNKFIFILLVFVITSISAKLYDYYKKYIADKLILLIKSSTAH